MQTLTSAGTSLNQIPALFKKIPWTPGTRNLDYGGGKYDRATEFLASLGVSNHVYDPFNRGLDHNRKVLEMFSQAPADTVTLANVLNVIKEPLIRLEVLRHLRTLVKPEGLIYISCYRGKGKTPGPTSKGWQENRTLFSYVNEIRRVFPLDRLTREQDYLILTNRYAPKVEPVMACPGYLIQ